MNIQSVKTKWHELPKVAKIAVGVLAALFVGSLLFGGGEEPVAESGFPLKIKVESLEAQPHRRSIVMYGATQPSRDVNLNAQTQGMVVAVPGVEGEYLQAGDVILEVDARDRPERLAQAKALLAQREIEFEAARKLQKRGFQSEVALAAAKAQMEAARASLKQVELDVGFSKMTAPFDGLLEAVNVEIGDFVGIGTFGLEGPAARMVDIDPLLVVAELDENDRAYVNIGLEATAKLADGRTVEGWVSYLGNVADEASRTFTIEVEVPNSDNIYPAGVTATLTVPGQSTQAYKVSASVLALDDVGRVGIKRLDESNKVVFEPVDIIEETPDAIWLGGLPPQLRLITSGQAYVSAGQEIPAEAVVSE